MDSITRRQILARRQERRASRRKGHAGRWILIGVLFLTALSAIGVAAGVGTVYALYKHYAEGYVPIEEKLRQTNVGLTEIYDRNGIFLGRLPNPDAQLLEPVPLANISPAMIEATISTEDDAFYDHPGFNWRGLFRAAKERYIDKNEDYGSGGSSITQQLVKNVYICPSIVTSDQNICTGAERTVQRKLKEIAYAIELEQDYTKEQILEYYLNSISYADRYIGVEAAAQGYFKKPASELTLAEAALLAGIPSSPSLYHPRVATNCLQDGNGQCILDAEGRTTVAGEAKLRQEAVIDLMVDHGRLTAAEAAVAKAEQLKVYAALNPVRAASFIDNQVEPRLVRMCEAGILPKISGATDCVASVHSAGYRVTSTIDIVETENAQALIREQLDSGLAAPPVGCNCYNAAIATIDPHTGQIIVYAPNVDPSATSDPRIRGDIDQLTEINQPGSSFKPVVYLAWFDGNNKAPMSTFWDTSPLNIEGTAITNPRGDGGSEGLISARAGLGGSQNVPAFRAAQEAGVDNVIAMAKAVGITTLDQNFDPTWSNHDAVQYGASIATGGANIRAIDMAYANAVFSNMGVMVGVPHLARTIDPGQLRSISLSEGADWDLAREQALEFQRGHTRLPGTRELDPVVVLRVENKDGEVIYDHVEANDLQSIEVVNPGSVWLVHSIISDCNSRFIIWGCGNNNDDLRLESFIDGVEIPTGVKTGTQQGPLSAADTLETWMNGYSRDAATAVWVGNANNELVRDGPQANYAAANTTVRLFKHWMSEYTGYLMRNGAISSPRGFDEIQPENVARRAFRTPSTDRVLGGGGCDQVVTAWVRTDVTYESECYGVEIDTRNGLLASEETPPQFRRTEQFVKLPTFAPEGARALAARFKIPIAPTERSTGQVPVVIVSPANGRTLSEPTPVVATVQVSGLRGWTLEIGEGAAPAEWRQIGNGDNNVTDATVGMIIPAELNEGVYTIRLSATGSTTVNLVATVSVNIRKGPTPTPTFGPGQPGRTPTPGGPQQPTPTSTPFVPNNQDGGAPNLPTVIISQ